MRSSFATCRWVEPCFCGPRAGCAAGKRERVLACGSDAHVWLNEQRAVRVTNAFATRHNQQRHECARMCVCLFVWTFYACLGSWFVVPTPARHPNAHSLQIIQNLIGTLKVQHSQGQAPTQGRQSQGGYAPAPSAGVFAPGPCASMPVAGVPGLKGQRPPPLQVGGASTPAGPRSSSLRASPSPSPGLLAALDGPGAPKPQTVAAAAAAIGLLPPELQVRLCSRWAMPATQGVRCDCNACVCKHACAEGRGYSLRQLQGEDFVPQRSSVHVGEVLDTHKCSCLAAIGVYSARC